jgi:ankyrin repeat protein
VVNKGDAFGTTSLHNAAVNGSAECVKLLLEAKAEPNKGDKLDGITPLYTAAGKGHTECVKLLLEAKADPNKGDRRGETPLYTAKRANRNEYRNDRHDACIKLLKPVTSTLMKQAYDNVIKTGRYIEKTHHPVEKIRNTWNYFSKFIRRKDASKTDTSKTNTSKTDTNKTENNGGNKKKTAKQFKNNKRTTKRSNKRRLSKSRKNK